MAKGDKEHFKHTLADGCIIGYPQFELVPTLIILLGPDVHWCCSIS